MDFDKRIYLILGRLLAGKGLEEKLSNEEWDLVYELAASDWMIGSLGGRIQELPEEFQPPIDELIAFTTEVYEFQLYREGLIRQEIAFLQANLTSPEDLVWLKGSEDILLGMIKPGLRWLMDVDVVIPESRLKTEWAKLLSDGYFNVDESNNPHLKKFNWDGDVWHHAPSIASVHRKISVEMHRDIGHFDTRSLLPLGDCFERSQVKVLEEGTSYRFLSPTDGMIHRIAHSYLLNLTDISNVIELRHLFNLWIYFDFYKNEVDWLEVKQRFSDFNKLQEFETVLYLLEVLFDEHVNQIEFDRAYGMLFLEKAFPLNEKHGPLNIFKNLYKHLKVTCCKKRVIEHARKRPKTLFGWVAAYLNCYYARLIENLRFRRLKNTVNKLVK